MNVQFAVDRSVKEEHTSLQMTELALAQAGRHNGTDLNQVEFDVDPELHGEVEINLPRDTQASARTRTTMSVKSKKSDTAESRANVVRSRGRPIKPHETEPFLSIDTLPADKTFTAEKTNISGYTPRPSTNKSGVPAFDRTPMLSQHSPYMQPYSTETPRPPSPSLVSDKKSPLPGSAPLSVSRPTSGRSLEFHFVPHIEAANGSRPGTASKVAPGSRPNSGSARPKGVSKPRVSSRVENGSRPGSQARGRTNVGQFRSMPSRNGRITPANTPFQSTNKLHQTPNCQIKSPFKHSIMQPITTTDGRVTPSMGMKERTTLAAHHLNKILTVANEKDAHKVAGKLKKGKLKPLYPVSKEGPSIEKCRGIIAEGIQSKVVKGRGVKFHSSARSVKEKVDKKTRQYGASPSRTLQRRMHLINTIPNVHEYLYDRPRTVESVHRTSIASSIDFNNIDYSDNLDSNRMLPDETLYHQPTQDSIIDPVTPENTFVPIQTQENTQENIILTDRTPRMFATEVNPNEEQGPVENGEPLSNQLQHELYIGESQEIRKETLHRDSNNSNKENEATNQENGVADDVIGERNEAGTPRAVSASKSVRFVEENVEKLDVENTKQIKQKTNASIAKMDKAKLDTEVVTNESTKSNEEIVEESDTISKKNKLNKSSCKNEEVNDIYKKRKDEDDDDKKEEKENKGRDSTADTSSQQPRSADKKGDNSSGNTDRKGGNHGKQATGVSCGIRRTKSASLTRPQSGGKQSHRSTQAKDKKSLLEGRAGSRNGHCSKFERSKASKSHTPNLQVSSVIHGDSVATTLRPESPSRSPGRPSSPSRRTPAWSCYDSHGLQGAAFFSHCVDLDYETSEDVSKTGDFYENSSHKSRVKFMIEGDTPEVDTIFIEEDDNVALRMDKDITFDALDSELAALRSNIQNQIEHNIESEPVEDETDDASEADLDIESDEEELEVETASVTVDTIRGDYSTLLDKYRLRCMDRSESVGVISGMLVTPRDTNVKSYQWRANSQVNRPLSANGSEGKLSTKSRGTTFTDSGHGSVDNLSEVSKTASTAISDIPRLELGSCSDLGLGSARSDVTDKSDVTITQKMEQEPEEETKNLLEMVCDSLAPPEKMERPKSRQDMEEDMSALKVVATTKSLSKSKTSKSLKPSGPAAPFPPLCFTINARPPKGFLYYFAYGPDMNPNRFSSYIKRDIQDRFWGLLFGFNLVFNKRGLSEEAGGFANIEFNPLRSVEGCLYKITQDELQVLDKCVGYPEHFEHLVLPVWMSNSKDPEGLGLAQYCVPALTFIAQNNWTETEKPLSCDYAISQCIKSADLVTPEYRESLVSMATQQQILVSA